MSDLTIFTARQVVTMWEANPTAPAVAVRDGRVVGVGSVDQLRAWGDATVSDRFADKVLMPGLVEAHSHVHAGAQWAYPYVGYFDRRGPDGAMHRGATTLDESLAQLREHESRLEDPAETLVVWGFDPIYFPDERLTATHLDTVSATRPIFVFHASGHLATVNNALMTAEGIDASTDVEGVVKGEDGRPIGELQEPPAMFLAASALGAIAGNANSEESIRRWADEARNTGTTSAAELATAMPFSPDAVERWQRVTSDPELPLRVSIYPLSTFGGPGDPTDFAQMVHDLDADATDKLRYPGVKLMMDGSVQGFTARLRPPGYFNGAPNGLWLVVPDQLPQIVEAHHRAGLNIHCHCNGDEAVDVFLDAVEHAQTVAPRADHRHTVQHCQLTHADQYRRMAALGVCANVFSNHIFFWGDQHMTQTVGPDRAASMNAAATALREGVPLSLHADTPVTPMGGLHSAWCAVNRVTASGQVLGEHERISVYEALRAVTVGAAYQIHADHLVGSIEPGKFADFAVLDEDPFEVDPMELRDIEVWGTVVGGSAFPAPGKE